MSKIEDLKLKGLVWNESVEKILHKWYDISGCYYWLHERSYRVYNKRNYLFSIPIIVLSTLTGTFSMGTSSIFPESYSKNVHLIVGGINISVGIITTLQTFFRYSQESGFHNTVYSDWAKLRRMIELELTLDTSARQDCSEFVSKCYNEIERLSTTSPIIPREVVREFRKKFGKQEFVKPELTGQFLSVSDKNDNIKTLQRHLTLMKQIENSINSDGEEDDEKEESETSEGKSVDNIV